MASQSGYHMICSLLLCVRAVPNTCTHGTQLSPLMLAASNGHLEAVRVLLNRKQVRPVAEHEAITIDFRCNTARELMERLQGEHHNNGVRSYFRQVLGTIVDNRGHVFEFVGEPSDLGHIDFPASVKQVFEQPPTQADPLQMSADGRTALDFVRARQNSLSRPTDYFSTGASALDPYAVRRPVPKSLAAPYCEIEKELLQLMQSGTNLGDLRRDFLLGRGAPCVA